MSKKNGFILLLVFIFFVYGFAIGFFKIFPFKQTLAIKHYMEHNYGFFAEDPGQATPSGVEVYNTELKRLLIKKIGVSPDVSFGGGVTAMDNLLFVVTNKGTVFAYDIHRFSEAEISIEDVPMNYKEFIQTSIPYQNEFRLNWFRVNGVYSEPTGQQPENHRLYVSHNGYDSVGGCITFNVSYADLEIRSSGVFQDGEWNTLFTASPCIDPDPEGWLGYRAYAGNISGGRIIEYDKEHLLVSVGDYNHHGLNEMPSYAMDETNPYGKYILMNKETGEWTIYAKGSRNASGLYKDGSGTIWSAENGPRGGDELNIIEEGRNFGWPHVSHGVWYSPEFQLENHLRGTHPEYDKPVFSWVPSIAPSNMVRIEGDKFEHWRGDLIIGTMGDQSLRRLRMTDERSVMYDERIPIGHRVRDMTLLQDGRIAVITDDSYLLIIDDGGPIHREMNDEERERMTELDKLDGFVAGSAEGPEPVKSAGMIYEMKCASCHNLSGENQIGPHLQNIYEREVGGLDKYPYSNRLQADNRSWTPELMRQFLLNPDREFSGNRMVQVELNEAEADSLILYLKQ